MSLFVERLPVSRLADVARDVDVCFPWRMFNLESSISVNLCVNVPSCNEILESRTRLEIPALRATSVARIMDRRPRRGRSFGRGCVTVRPVYRVPVPRFFTSAAKATRVHPPRPQKSCLVKPGADRAATCASRPLTSVISTTERRNLDPL